MNILQRVDQQCRATPQRVALVEGDRSLDYAALQARYRSIATLFECRDSASRPVAIALERGIDAAVSIFAVLHQGGCYIPLDMGSPHPRLKYIVEDSDTRLLLGQGPRPDWVPPGRDWIDIDADPACSSGVVTPATVEASTIACILYTSGSTGTPRGVALSHTALANFRDWSISAFLAGQSHRVASLAPFYFDLSVFDLHACLGSGQTVLFVPSRLTLAPGRLCEWLGNQSITLWYTVPSILAFLAYKGNLGPAGLPDLKALLFAGEVFPPASLKKLAAQLPEVDLYNLYGPTETNVCCFWKVERSRLQGTEPVPIGGPACGADLRIDPETGDLRVRSRSNFSGYWNQGRIEADSDPGEWYATGDHVSINKHGEYCYHGRLDRMLKCSGYRIEPAEIETVIHQHPDVMECAVIGIADRAGGQRIAAAVQLHRGNSLDGVMKMIRDRLPGYMLPSACRIVDRMPRLGNGKIDYANLQAMFNSTPSDR